jgi:hypothetical protein
MDDQETITSSRAERSSRRRMMTIGIIAAVVLVLIIAGFVLMIQSGTTGVVRDVIIILLALESLIVVGLMLVLVFQVISLVRMLRDEVKPLLESAQDTLATARGTTTYVSKKVVSPSIAVAGSLAGLRRMAQVLIGRKK